MTETYVSGLLCLYSPGMSTLVVWHKPNVSKSATQAYAQHMGKAIIRAKAKLGALLKANPPGFTKGNSGKVKQNPLPPGVSKRTSHQAQAIAANPEYLLDFSFGLSDFGTGYGWSPLGMLKPTVSTASQVKRRPPF